MLFDNASLDKEVTNMKKIFCDICNEVIETDMQKVPHFTIKITSPFIDVKNIKAHCCDECYEKLMVLLNRAESEE